jgi:hypothetical protein
MLRKLILIASISMALGGCGATPSKEKVKEAISKLIPNKFEIVSIQKLKEVPGLVEVVLRADQQPIVIYMDQKAKYIVSGNVMAVDSKRNLTMERQKSYLGK